ncbi:MAG: hypothetical protein HY858_05720 [Candidatus Solibacter usitatus]|nr:hypothetical protein [Candidatus Solibacter usitatus]
MKQLLLLGVLGLPAFAQWAPFEMIWNVEGSTAADVSFLLDAPAGRAGFVAARNGHLYTGDGKRLRLWGVNFSFAASFPPKELAPAVAAHLARFGVNCVRIHHHDWRSPRGLIDSAYSDSRHLHAGNLDRLDFLVAELKKRGIYVDLNLNVARAFQEADGVKDASETGYAKALTLFDPRMIELQREFATAYLTHRNPYTGNEYRNEPAVALVEILNENSLIESWVRGRLRGQGFDPKTADRTWGDIPASYERDLTALWKAWAKTDLPRLDPKDFASASAERFRKEAEFYMHLEEKFYREFQAFLKQDLGVKAPVVGTSVHGGGLPPYPILRSTAQMDVVDAHTYWQHPRYVDDPVTRRRGFEIANTPQVDQPGRGALAALARAAVAGKPFIVSEVNEPYPNEYGAELIPLLAAYGGLQDWDGLFWYSFEHSSAENWKPRPPGHFDIRQDAVKMSQLAASAVIFQRGGFRAGRTTLVRNYTPEQVAESLRLKSTEQPWFTPGLNPAIAAMAAVRVGRFDDKRGAVPRARPEEAVRSGTGELMWRKGLLTGGSKGVAMVVGRMGGVKASAGRMDVESETGFGAVLLVELDADSLLLTAGGRTANEGMKWNQARTSTPETGTAPMLIEPFKAVVTLRGFKRGARLSYVALDGAGRPMGTPRVAEESGGRWKLFLDAAAPWYRVELR